MDRPELHPSESELLAFNYGRLEETELESVSRHVDGCLSCCDRLRQLAERDRVLPWLRRIAQVKVADARRQGDTAPAGESISGGRVRADAGATTEGVRVPKPAGPEHLLLHREAMPSPEQAELPSIRGYDVEAVLGRGGMGVVYQARQQGLNRRVALKMIRAGSHSGPEELARFRAEAESVARLVHPHIVQIYEIGEHDGCPFFSQEYVAGGSLAAKLGGVPQSARASAAFVATLAEAVHYAHRQGLIHRDLKPDNVLLRPPDVGQPAEAFGIPKIADFGLAKQLDRDSGQTQSGSILGTPSYMAPEQATGRAAEVGAPTDVYALGAILYAMLTGQPPFRGPTVMDTLEQVRSQEPVPPTRLQPGVPRDLETICLKCLRKPSAARYPTARALADDLRRFCAGEPIRARPVGRGEKLWRWCKRNPGVAGLLALVFLVLLGGAAVSTFFGLEAQKRAGEAEKALGQARTEEGRARTAQEYATKEATKAKAAKRASDMEAARLKFKDAIGHAQAGAVDLGLYGLIEALRLAPDDAEAAPFRRALCTSFAFWSRQLPTLRYVLENQDFRGGPPDGDTSLRTVGKDGKYFVTSFWTSKGEQNLQLREMGTGRLVELGWQLARDETVNGFTPDSALVLTRTVKDGKAFLQLRDTVTGKPAGPASPFTGPEGGSNLPILVWSNGAVAAFGTAEGVRFWGLAGARWYPLSLPNETAILPLILSRDQKPLAVVFHPAPQFSQHTPRLEFWDVTTGKSVPFPVRLAAGSDERVSLDGRIFATRHLPNVDGQCRWWDLDTGRLIDRWYPRQMGGSQPAPDAQTVLANSLDGHLGLFALDTGFQRGGNLARVGRDFPEGRVIGEPVLIYRDGQHLRAWNTQALALQATAAANPGVRTFAGDAVILEHTRELFDGGLLSPHGKLAFFNRTGTGQQYWRINQVFAERVTAFFNRTVTGHEYGRLVDVARRQPIGPALGSQRDRNLMVFSPDEKLLALAPHNYMSGAPDPVVHVYDTASGRLRLPPLRMPRFIFSLAFTPDGRTLVVGCVGVTVLLDAQSGQPRGFLQQASAADGLAVSPDGKALAIGYRDGWPGDGAGVRLWDLTTAKPIGPFHPIADFRQVTFMDQGRSVLVATGGATRLHVFDRETGRPSAAALPPSDIVTNFWGTNIAARSRDAVFAFRSSAGTIEQWDAAAGHAVGEPMVHPCAVWRMQYSPDGRLLATVCADNSVRLWDSATGLPLGPPLLHVAPVRSLCFAPLADAQGRAGGVNPLSRSEAYHLVTASAAGDIHDWHLPAAFPDDPERLTLWIEAAAGCKQGRTETALLDAATWRERGRQLEERWPEAAAALASQRGADLGAELAAWHEVRAGEAEATGNAFALLWHLDRLAQQRPDDWRLAARRGTALADSADFAAAEAAFALAAKKGASAALADWYSHGAVMASGARRWQVARWYLDQQIAARPNDWRLYAERAEVHGQLGKLAERDADLERAVARGAGQSWVLRLADSRVRLRQWQKAAECYVKAAGRGPLPLPAWHQLALVCLEKDDLAAYRNICKGMVNLAKAAPKAALTPEVANAIAWMCALGPQAIEDFDPVVALAEGAVKAGGNARVRHDRLNTLGAVLCRAGRYQEARQRLDESIRAAGKGAAAADWLFLALVHLDLDDAAQARQCLAKVPQPNPREGEVNWVRLETEVLRREVETRLKQRSERSR